MKVALLVLSLAVCWHQGSAEVNALRQMMVDMAEIGCFNEEALNYGVDSLVTQPDIMNKYWCVVKCVVQGYEYAALKNGDTCICVSQYEDDPGYYADPDVNPCNVACVGKPYSEPNCGSASSYLLLSTLDFNKPANSYKMSDQYDRCYGDFETGNLHDLHESTITGPSMTVSICFSHCMYEGFARALLSAGSVCSCGDTPGHLGEAAEASCSVACSGDGDEMCGAATFMSAYYVPSGTYQIKVVSEGGVLTASDLTSSGNSTVFRVKGLPVGSDGGAPARGIHVAVLDRASGQVLQTQNYDTFWSAQAANNFDMFVHQYVDEDTLILVSIVDDALVKCLQTPHKCFPFLQTFGASIITESLGIRDSYAFIGYNGTTCEFYKREMVDEVHSPSENGNALPVQAKSYIPVVCYGRPNRDPSNRPAYLVEVRSEGGDSSYELDEDTTLFHVAGRDVVVDGERRGRGLNFHVFDRTTRNTFESRRFDPYGPEYYNDQVRWNQDLRDFINSIPDDSVVLISVFDDAAVSVNWYDSDVDQMLYELGKVNGFDFRDSYCLVGYKGSQCGVVTDLRRDYGNMGWIVERRQKYTPSGRENRQTKPVVCRARVPSNAEC